MSTRRKGFTLIELLVVIAIIAILAAMLFPVFARARESARKIQCLSNVKNIAMAVQMYLSDYDRFPPGEHNANVLHWLKNKMGCCDRGIACRAMQANPYVRWPVVLDEYTKNRDVWRCPSAANWLSYGINWGYGSGNWFQYMADKWDLCRLQPCSRPYPTGWGGSITDSVTQGACAGESTGGLAQAIGCPTRLQDMKTSQMEDPVRYVVAADSGQTANDVERTSNVAYPDVCRIDHAACDPTCGYDWVNCPQTQQCGGGKGVYQFGTDVEFRKTHGKARHMGGSNLGFADGHAAWMDSEAILFDGTNASGYGHGPNRILNLECCFVDVKQNY
jgi:prepilin-type N-terminal cleavage/methylation domain-containing protein/prepilin-type processing-associated H-X9-DG protein